MPSTRSTTTLLLTAGLAALAGCGSSTSSPAKSASVARPATATPIHSTTPTVSRPPSHPRSPRAQFASFAKAVNLRPEDLPGFRVTPRKARGRAHNQAFEDSTPYRRCFHVAKQAKALAKVRSRTFKTGSDLHLQQVSSKVEVEPTLATASRELAEAKKAVHSPSARKCFAREFDALGTQSEPIHVGAGTVRVLVGNLRLVPFSISAATHGTGGGFGLSLSARVTYVARLRGRRFTHRTSIELDTLGFLVGRAGITLDTLSFGSSLPPQLEAGLLSRLVSRAIAAGQANPAVTR